MKILIRFYGAIDFTSFKKPQAKIILSCSLENNYTNDLIRSRSLYQVARSVFNTEKKTISLMEAVLCRVLRDQDAKESWAVEY